MNSSVLGALVRDGFSALPVVEARPCGGFALVGWVTREQMVERVYRQQRRAFEEARVRTSLGRSEEHTSELQSQIGRAHV